MKKSREAERPANRPPKTASISEKTSVRLNAADHRLIRSLHAKLGTRHASDVLRQGLRALAERHGIPL